MKLMDTLKQMVNKEIGDEWVGANGVKYKLDETGIISCDGGLFIRQDIKYIDKNLEYIKEPFRPKKGDYYYFIGAIGGDSYIENELRVRSAYYTNSERDEARRRQGNFYETQEKANKKLNKVLSVL